MNDLDDAITALDRASDAAPVSSHNRPVCLMNLGNGLYVRYGRHGDLDDLDRAVACYEEAVRETPVGSPDRPPRLVSLGNGLRNRYLRSHRLGDLDRAVACYEEAVGAAPVGSPDRPGHLNSLGNGLLSRYQYTGELDDLERAVAACADALNLTSADAPERLAYLNGFGNSLQDRYERLRRAEDLERAIEICEEAVGRAPPGSPHLPALLVNLGNVRQERYDRDGDADDLRRAVDSFRAACRKGLDASVEEGLRAAHNWGRWAAARASWSEAAEAYRYGLRAVRHLFRTQLGRRHKETWLWAAQAMPADAAYAFAMSGAPQDAVMALEGARVLLIAEALERNQADLARLRYTGHHDLYERYLTVVDRSSFLERAEPQDDSRAWERARSAELKAARAELDEVIDEIRQVQGFGRFLDSPTFQDLAAAASPELPLAYLASAKPGGLLIVVDGRNVTTCLLPGLTEEVFHEKVVQYFSKYDPEAPGRAVAGWSDAIYELGRWLWDVTIGPLLTQLRSVSAVVLIPVGPLALLPLHAAWTEDLNCPTGKRYALDDVLITYAPSARALTGARHRAAQTQPDFLLAVEEPWPVRGSSLPGASSEAQAAISAFGSRTCHLRHEDATRDAVVAGLREATVVHLVCHGYADLDRPLQSGMVLAGDILLTVEQLFGLRFESRLAVLSACDAGLPGTELPDEVVSLPTGLLQAGVAGVVAPLWAVPDERTMLLMVGFYQRWRQEGQEPAEALRQAQRWLRDSTNGELRSMFQALYDQGPAAWLAQATTQACYEAVLLKDPDERSFADPIGWAAFTYIGT